MIRSPLLATATAVSLGLSYAALAYVVLKHKTPRAVPAAFHSSAAPGATPVPATADGPLPYSPRLTMPVLGLDPRTLHSNFDEARGGHRHEAIDILAPRGTPVLAVADGVVKKLFHSIPGGITVYQYDASETLCFYYAHLDGYAPGLAEGQVLKQGDPVGFVGTTGNAPANTPHLHFAVYRLPAGKEWWKGTPIDPYPLLVGST